MALGGGIGAADPRPQGLSPTRRSWANPEGLGSLRFPLGSQTLGPLPNQVIGGRELGGRAEEGGVGMDPDTGPGHTALHGETAFPWHLPRVTTPSRWMMLGWSN